MDFFLVVGVMIPKSINPDACHENCIILYTKLGDHTTEFFYNLMKLHHLPIMIIIICSISSAPLHHHLWHRPPTTGNGNFPDRVITNSLKHFSNRKIKNQFLTMNEIIDMVTRK